jgi:flagellin-like protein
MWNIKNKEAVSPVIGVILMVAITVVLAAVLYVWVAGMGTGVKTTPTGYLNTPTIGGNATATPGTLQYINTTLISISTPISKGSVKVILVGASGTPIVLTEADTVYSSAIPTDVVTGISVEYKDYNNDDKLSAGDGLIIKNRGNTLRGAASIRLEYTDTTGTIAEIEIPGV